MRQELEEFGLLPIIGIRDSTPLGIIFYILHKNICPRLVTFV